MLLLARGVVFNSVEIMAGHSRWAKVKTFKGAIDAKRGRIFAKLGREISIAVKIAGSDPDMNPRLRMALLRGRAANMPTDNVGRAIHKGAGTGKAPAMKTWPTRRTGRTAWRCSWS